MNDIERMQRASRRAAWRWGGAVVVMLGLQILLGVTAITLATRPDADRVIDDYYGKAMRWDADRGNIPSPPNPLSPKRGEGEPESYALPSKGNSGL